MTKERIILVPLDGSVLAEGVLPYARVLARHLRAALLLLLVVPSRGSPNRRPGHPDQPDAAEAKQTLETTAMSLRNRSVCVLTDVAYGDPVEQILAAASGHGVELVLMATHGRGGLERLLIGSVADEVMRNCTRPVLLVVPSAFSTTLAGVELRRLLVPLDGSPLAESALPLTIRLAKACRASVTLVQALTPVTVSLAPSTYVADLGQWEVEQTEAARAYLQGICGRFPPSVPVDSIVIRTLSTGDTLVKYAQSAGVDLVIMSTHGEGGLRRLANGSKADLLVRSGVPTLLARPPASEGHRDRPAGERRSESRPRSGERAHKARSMRVGG